MGYSGMIQGTIDKIIEVIKKFRLLTHWGRVTHMCVSKLNTIGLYNDFLPGRRQALLESMVEYCWLDT